MEHREPLKSLGPWQDDRGTQRKDDPSPATGGVPLPPVIWHDEPILQQGVRNDTPGPPRSDPPPPQWNAGDVAKGVGIVILVVLVGLFIASVVAATTNVNRSFLGLGITAALELSLVAVVWRFSVKRYGCSWSALGLRPLHFEDARWAIPAGVFISLTVAMVYAGILTGLGLDDHVRSPSVFDDPGTVVLIIASIMAVAVAPVVEELLFRGFIFSGLLSRFTVKQAAIASAALFALAHIQPLAYAPIFIIGLVLVWVYRATGSLTAAMLVHASYNGVIVGISFAI